MRKITLIYIFFAVIGFGAFAQTETNVDKLLEFARIKKIEAERQKAEAIVWAKQNNLPVRQVLDDGTEMELMKIENGRPVYYITDNLGAAITTRTDKLWPSGGLNLNLDGSGYDKLGEWDGGAVRTTHQEFTNPGPSSRVTQVDGATSQSNHSTHVAGTLVANGYVGNAKGMAYNGNLKAYDWNNDENEMAAAATAGMEVSNHSYGYATGWYDDGGWQWNGHGISITEDYYFGFYDYQAQDWDEIAYNAPYFLIVKSAGNDRGEGPSYAGTPPYAEKDGGDDGYDCIAHAAIAKNVMTVGAVYGITNYTGPSDVVMTSFSSWGPCDDGRIKPDIVAKGYDLYSCGKFHNSNSYYTTMSGTSMSSPNTAGTLALLQQHYQNTHGSTPMRAATLKAMVLHTADEAGDHEGPDYRFGWGLLNAERAALKISEDANEQNVIDELILNDGNTWTRNVTISGYHPLRVTIVWTDVPGTPVAASLNPTDIMLVNDLDLSVSDNLKTIYYPYKLDRTSPSAAATNSGENNVDNVEMVYIPSTTAGTYTITVDHDGTLSGGSQAFSIIISGINEYTIAPSCVTSFTSPGNGATNVVLDPNLLWSVVGNADSYKLHVGSDGGGTTTPTNVVNGLAVGTNSYQLNDLDPNTIYYVQLFPQNNIGSASLCTIWSFTTATAISSFPPYTENFDGVSTPDLVSGWTSKDNLLAYWQSSTDRYQSSPNSMGCYHPTYYTDADSWLFTPPIQMVAGNNYNLSFYYQVYTSGHPESLKVMAGTSASPSGMSTILFDNNNITITSWTLSSSTFTPTSNGYYYFGFYAYSTNGGGIYIDDLSVAEIDNTTTWNGSVNNDWANSGNWSSGVPVSGKHAIIPGSLTKYPTISSASTIGYITIKSDASLIGAEHLTVSGPAVMERAISAYSSVGYNDGWHIIASPMNNIAIDGSDFEPGTFSPHLDDLYIFNEPTYYWLNYKQGHFSNFAAGEGYLHAVETAETKEFVGSFNTSDVTWSNLSYTPAQGNGWHMIGNQFQSPVTWNTANWSLNNIEVVAKVLKSDGTGYMDVSNPETIAANQGFFIRITNSSNSITIPLAARTHATTTFHKNNQNNRIVLKAYLDGSRAIETKFGFNDNATTGFDMAFDGHHFSFTTIANMYSFVGDDKMSTNFLPFPVQEALVIPVYFVPYQNRDYSMKAEGIETLNDNIGIYLEDLLTSQTIDLRITGNYDFTASQNDDPDRFLLHFKSMSGVNELMNRDDISVYSVNKVLYINAKHPLEGDVTVCNTIGQVVAKKQLNGETFSQFKLNVVQGVYIVNIISRSATYTEKVFVK